MGEPSRLPAVVDLDRIDPNALAASFDAIAAKLRDYVDWQSADGIAASGIAAHFVSDANERAVKLLKQLGLSDEHKPYAIIFGCDDARRTELCNIANQPALKLFCTKQDHEFAELLLGSVDIIELFMEQHARVGEQPDRRLLTPIISAMGVLHRNLSGYVNAPEPIDVKWGLQLCSSGGTIEEKMQELGSLLVYLAPAFGGPTNADGSICFGHAQIQVVLPEPNKVTLHDEPHRDGPGRRPDGGKNSEPTSGDGLWSEADTPSRWANRFGISWDTLRRRFSEGVIRHKKLSTKSYQIHLDDLPKQ